ncbi:uracil-DNA glycosylase family protein [Exiguobacterium artemiae]
MLNSLSIFEQAIRSLPIDLPLTRQDLCVDSFLLQQEQDLSVYYSPIGKYINPSAKVVFIGITPGFEQMRIAYEEAADAFHHGATIEETSKIVKYSASFAGPMRRNLTTMLDELELHHLLNISSTATLFHTNQELLHTTSILRHPVFYRDKNYTGHQPKIDRTPLLQHYAYEHFAAELNQLPDPVILVPFGRVVDSTVRTLLHQGRIKKHTVLFGFPILPEQTDIGSDSLKKIKTI